MKLKIIPSIIAHSQDELERRIAKVRPVSSFVQLDVMDNDFVKHSSLEFNIVLSRGVHAEAHLMMRQPMNWLKHNIKVIDSFIVHYESLADLNDCIDLAKSYKKKIGIALNPETDVEAIAQHLKHIDKVLIMTVHPGAYGAAFLPEVVRKISHIRQLAPACTIQVDGGITPLTMHLCKDAGAHEFVVGSYLQHASDIKHAWKQLEKHLRA